MPYSSYGGGDYQSAVYWLKDIGLVDVLIPFALIFTVMFGVLDKVKVFKEKKFNAVIAICIALLTVVPHVLNMYPPEYDIIVILMTALPEVSLVAIAIVLFLIMTGLLMGTQEHGKIWGVVETVAPWAALGLILFIFSRAIFAYRLPYWLENLFSPQLGTIIIMLIVAGLVVKLVVGDKKGKKGKGLRLVRLYDDKGSDEEPEEGG